MKGLLSDLFRDPSGNWDIGRIVGVKAVSAYTFAFLYALLKLHSVPDWSALGVGYTGVLGGAGILIGVKDIAVAKASQQPPGASS